MAEDDWDGWKMLTGAIGDKVQLVGDDLFVTNTERACARHRKGVANSILVKVNQIGTLTETLETVETAHKAGYTGGDVAPLRRDRGRDHRRPGGRDQLRPDQDRLAVALGPAGQVQPADPDRRTAGRPRRAMRGTVGSCVTRSRLFQIEIGGQPVAPGSLDRVVKGLDLSGGFHFP